MLLFTRMYVLTRFNEGQLFHRRKVGRWIERELPDRKRKSLNRKVNRKLLRDRKGF